ncbi:GNAT family N-acetyltransferase [Carboxylicivirga marina]|uniref:GNAT family N-acetyltransferase n=1 Tax=Carboxylicivirga marina TaxID=2800988 RepID=UPI0025972F80|nr:GNAT family N-acetyltransferase [uncultured Carboxylicivirga sp.]
MSKYTFKTLDKEEFPKWEQLLAKVPEPSPFMSSDWFSSYCEASNEKFEIVACFKNDELIAGFAYLYRVKFGKYKLIVNLLGIDNYMVILTRDTKLESKKESHYFEIIKEFTNFLEQQYSHVEFTLNCATTDIRPLQWNGYSEEIRYTYRGAIKSPEQLLSEFNPDIRNKIKKAQKLNYSFDSSSSQEQMKLSYDLIDRSLKKNNKPHILAKEQFISLLTKLSELNKAIVCNIFLDDVAIATRVLVLNSEIAVDFQAGGNEEYFNTGLNQLLSYKIFEMLHEKGVKTYDFRGANTPSIAKYKSGFNFIAEPYYHVAKDSGQIFKLLLRLKKLTQK